jgi:hypothetical protein
MVKHFDAYILLKRSNILQVEPEPLVAQAVALLQSEEGFEWRVEITADSLAQADYAMEKQDRVEFIATVTPFIEKAGQMAQVVPEVAPLLVGMLKWAASAFRNTSEIETMLDQALDSLQKQPPQQKPDPRQEQAQVELQMRQQEHALDMQSKQADVQMQQAKAMIDLQSKRTSAQIEQQQAMQQARMKEAEMQMDFRRMVAENAAALLNPPRQ